MKLEATAGALSVALNAAAAAGDDKIVVQALAMAHLVAQNGQVACTVDSLDRRITAIAEVTVVEPGEASARASALVGVLNGLPLDRTIKVESRDDGVGIIVRAGRSRFTIDGLPINTLPRSSGLADPAAIFDLETEDLRRLLEACEHAISTEETRYYLNGIYLHAADKVLRGVATDGHRLCWFDLAAPAGADGMPGIIIPGKIIAILIKLLKRKPTPEIVSLRLSDKLIEVSLPDLTLTAKLIDATFPDYLRIVPAASSNTVTVDTDNLRQALARIEALFDIAAKRGMRTVALSWSNGALHVGLTTSNETDDVIEDVKITGVGRFAARISYLVEALEALGGKQITLDTNGPKHPAIRITDPDCAAVLALVMPVRF